MDLNRLSSCTYILRNREVEYAFRRFSQVGFGKLDLWGRPPHFSANPAECAHNALSKLCEFEKNSSQDMESASRTLAPTPARRLPVNPSKSGKRRCGR